MKILLLHNYYRSSAPSGEDLVFQNEMELLKSKQVDVKTFLKHNDDIEAFGIFGKLSVPFRNMWSVKTAGELKLLLEKEKPDICHFHNIFYLISPSAYHACKEHGIPVVQTLHNYRFFCSTGLFYRDGHICEECVEKTLLRGLVHKCYRNSLLYSLPLGLMQYYHKVSGTWDTYVDLYIALTEFGKSKFISSGLKREKIVVKPNFIFNRSGKSPQWDNYAIFAGRLSSEKGISTLLKAWELIDDFSLKVIGDGPMMDYAKRFIGGKKRQNIELLGRVPNSKVIELMGSASFVIFPSESYETFGLTIIEAYSCGKPVLASRMGTMEELVKEGQTGLLFEQGNAFDLAEKARILFDNRDMCMKLGDRAREEFDRYYTPERNFEMLMNAYRKVLK